MTGDANPVPLSWHEARLRLRNVLEEYLDEPTPSRRREDGDDGDSESVSPTEASEKGNSIIAWCIHHDLDLWLGAISISISLLILSCLSFQGRKDGEGTSYLRASAGISVYIAQVAGSTVLVVASMISLWMVRRRRFLCLNDSDSAKRQEVSRFLRRFDAETKTIRSRSSHESVKFDKCALGLCGTSLTDLYPVYRRQSSGDEFFGSWCRIPSLLLVKGDFVALQIGDIAPADCTTVDGAAIKVAAGESLSLHSVNQTATEVISELPPGRTTLPTDSEHLLSLCNGMRVFQVAEAPMYDFIRHKPARSRSSQMARKVEGIRKVLLLGVPVFFVLTTIIVFIRPGAAAGDLSLVLTLPFLAALGVIPIIGPAFVFFLEIIGTARILTTVHPYASAHAERPEYESMFPATTLLVRYIFATFLTRLDLWDLARQVNEFVARHIFVMSFSSQVFSGLVRVPPASLNLLEKFGVATAFAVVDDELACEPHSIPQQLLIPSSKGLKLLDLCPAYDDDSDYDSESDTIAARKRAKGFDDSDDSSEEGTAQNFHATLRRKILRRRRKRRRNAGRVLDGGNDTDESDSSLEVQFEEPTWWQHLPTLKCIGLASLVMDEPLRTDERLEEVTRTPLTGGRSGVDAARSSLVRLVCSERQRHQLHTLSQCIGFSTEPNSFGRRGDLSPFTERLRLHVLSDTLLKERLEIDAHERSSEQSRSWGVIRPDSTSVIVQDSRSKAYQLLTVGDPSIVTSLCNEAWQGEISTILPLAQSARQTILETTENWKLGDLDVTAFSYSPVPHTLESRLESRSGLASQTYLFEQNNEASAATSKDKNASQDWSLIRNQVFLGVLGSLIVPRREIQNLLSVLNDAGVRFVYFSPRNMRRQKELASQMGIDVAWNCAISLRPLESGEEDPHRMVSNYADWDINAKLPHGVDDVRKHLEEVDNVPLLVSLFTDVTKKTTREMVEIFQDYNDTVITIGLSHLPRNDSIFSTSDIAVGIDVLTDVVKGDASGEDADKRISDTNVRPSELEFVSAMASHSCAFRFRGESSVSHISSIIERSRAALEAATAAGVFLTAGGVSFSLYVLFSACASSTTIPYVPLLGSVLYLQFVLPVMGIAMTMSDAQPEAMHRVPPKNDQAVMFARREGRRLYTMLLLKGILPAVFPQLMYLIAFGELVLFHDPDLVASECPGMNTWVQVIRCDALRDYSGMARVYAGALSLSHFVFNIAIASASFVFQFGSILELHPWVYNRTWAGSLLLVVVLTVVYIVVAVGTASASTLPWYYYFLSVFTPFICLACNEFLKRTECRHEARSEKLRRLQFETRLGAWSPK